MKCNYEIYNQEMLAIIRRLEHLLEDTKFKFEV